VRRIVEASVGGGFRPLVPGYRAQQPVASQLVCDVREQLVCDVREQVVCGVVSVPIP